MENGKRRLKFLELFTYDGAPQASPHWVPWLMQPGGHCSQGRRCPVGRGNQKSPCPSSKPEKALFILKICSPCPTRR